MRKAILALALAAALISVGTAPALAAQPERETFELECSNGETFEVVVNGNGEFTPGRLVGSTRVLIPTAFDDFSFQAVLPNGTVTGGAEPGSAKGGGNAAKGNPRPRLTCTFGDSFTVTAEDADEFGFPAGTVITFSGEVTGFLTGRR